MSSFLLSLFRALARPNGLSDGDLLSTRHKYRLLLADGYIDASPTRPVRPAQQHAPRVKARHCQIHLVSP